MPKQCFALLCVPLWKTDQCRCKNGGRHNGGKDVNADGVCEYRCSKPFGVKRFCGEGPEYEEGDSIDCNPAQGDHK